MVDANVLGRLREALVAMKRDKDIEAIVSEKDAVLARFQPIFSPEHVNAITAEEFKSFLPFQNNRHWNGLQRLGPRICDNMQKLQKALITLLDEAQPIDTRLNAVVSQTFGMGKNIATAILQIHEPARYGVWNNCSEANLKMLGLWPDFKRGESFGDKYVKVNQILLKLQDDLKTDLWTLDALWWYLEGTGSNGPQGKPPPEGGAEGVATDQRFALERHLHEFMRDNWDCLPLAKEWKLYSENGDDEAGYEYPCDVGRIDLLAKHKSKPQWLVIELKRAQTSDQTVGQLLRYVGWVKRRLAEKGDEVHGLIICHEADDSLRYAIEAASNIEIRQYRVEFHLQNPEKLRL